MLVIAEKNLIINTENLNSDDKRKSSISLKDINTTLNRVDEILITKAVIPSYILKRNPVLINLDAQDANNQDFRGQYGYLNIHSAYNVRTRPDVFSQKYENDHLTNKEVNFSTGVLTTYTEENFKIDEMASYKNRVNQCNIKDESQLNYDCDTIIIGARTLVMPNGTTWSETSGPGDPPVTLRDIYFGAEGLTDNPSVMGPSPGNGQPTGVGSGSDIYLHYNSAVSRDDTDFDTECDLIDVNSTYANFLHGQTYRIYRTVRYNGAANIPSTSNTGSFLKIFKNGTELPDFNSEFIHLYFDKNDTNEYKVILTCTTHDIRTFFIKASPVKYEGSLNIVTENDNYNCDVDFSLGVDSYTNLLPRYLGGKLDNAIKIKENSSIKLNYKAPLDSSFMTPNSKVGSGLDLFQLSYKISIELIHEKIEPEVFEFADLEDQKSSKSLNLRNIQQLKVDFITATGEPYEILTDDDIRISFKFLEKQEKEKEEFKRPNFFEDDFKNVQIYDNQGGYQVGLGSQIKRKLF